MVEVTGAVAELVVHDLELVVGGLEFLVVELDMLTGPLFEGRLAEIPATGPQRLIIDLSE